MKHFTTSDYNKFTNNILDEKIKNEKLVNEPDFAKFRSNSDLDKKTKNW